jgi:hypothetical protein
MTLLHRTIAVLCVASALAVFAQERSALPDPRHALEGAALVDALRRGGYTLYFRHTTTDFSQNDAAMTGYEDCATQRNLTELGRQQARAIGATVRAMKLPIGEVLASPYCRTMETGRLVFGRAEASADVRGFRGPAGQPDYTRLVKLLSTPPKPGTLRAVSSHGNPFRGVAGLPYLAEGEAAVVKPLGNDFAIVARIRVDDWKALAATR